MPNRFVCTAIEELRTLLQLHRESASDEFSENRILHMQMLLEEIQTLVNRMEAGLEDQRDLRHLSELLKEVKGKVKKERKELNDLKEAIADLNEEYDFKDNQPQE